MPAATGFSTAGRPAEPEKSLPQSVLFRMRPGKASFVQGLMRDFALPNNPSEPLKAMTTLNDTTVKITREIGASRDRVYAAWTDLKLARQWWGPDGVETRALMIEPRVG